MAVLIPAEVVAPIFDPGLVVSMVSLVIDRKGVAWWVRPDGMVIIHVETGKRFPEQPMPRVRERETVPMRSIWMRPYGD